MALQTTFTPIALVDLHDEAARRKAAGWRFVEMHGVRVDAGNDLYYAFMKDGMLDNVKVESVPHEAPVPSVTDVFLGAFVFENETRELFQANIQDIAIDYDGDMYTLAEQAPMNFISPEQKAAKDKARKIARAKEAKARAARAKAASAADAPAAAGDAAADSFASAGSDSTDQHSATTAGDDAAPDVAPAAADDATKPARLTSDERGDE